MQISFDTRTFARLGLKALPFVATLLAATSPSFAANEPNQAARTEACAGDNGGITLPRGFCATVFADNIGHARHMAVGSNGVVYVNTWSGLYYGNDTPPPGGFLIALQDINGDGQADVVARFGDTLQQGSHGGTGIAIYKGALYAEVNDRIVRYALAKDGILPTANPETVVSGLPLTGDHPMHPFAIDANGNLFVDVATATNSCQPQNRMPNVPGDKPCKELETRGGIWRYDANKPGQVFSPKERYATGIRNADGIAIDSTGLGLFATQHGRDELSENWPGLYKPEQGANLPAEELLRVEQGADYGWPECYYDDIQQKLVLAPEYGGDGGKAVGVCADKKGPVASFPAHWAPNDLLLYSGEQFPTAYRGGAFIAFHGSWNRAPFPQGGYNVVFQPLPDGKASGKFVVFADGFAGGHEDPGEAAHRPSGVEAGPDALYLRRPARPYLARDLPWRPKDDWDRSSAGGRPLRGPYWDKNRQCRTSGRRSSQCRGRCDGRLAGPLWPDPGAGRAWRAHLPWRERRDVCRLPWRQRQGHAARAKSDRRQVDLGRWQRHLDLRDHRQGRAEPEGLSERHAANGRRAAHADRRLGARRLCLGAQPKGRQLKIGLERSSVLARSATDRRKPEPFAAIPARLMRVGLPIFEAARRAIKKREL